jgi:glycosyltransferase involved in cell wall biosynthesis
MIFGGASHAGVQDALAACSVLVATSKREGLPTLVLEGMAHQKPVVVSAEPGSMEVVNQGEFGQIYPLGQIDDLVEQTQVAISIKVPSTSARQRVINEYDWRVVAPKLDALYRLDGSWQ